MRMNIVIAVKRRLSPSPNPINILTSWASSTILRFNKAALEGLIILLSLYVVPIEEETQFGRKQFPCDRKSLLDNQLATKQIWVTCAHVLQFNYSPSSVYLLISFSLFLLLFWSTDKQQKLLPLVHFAERKEGKKGDKGFGFRHLSIRPSWLDGGCAFLQSVPPLCCILLLLRAVERRYQKTAATCAKIYTPTRIHSCWGGGGVECRAVSECECLCNWTLCECRMTTTPLSLPPWKRRTCRFYLKVLCCILFLLIYFAIFLHESINATKLKQNAMRQVGTGLLVERQGCLSSSIMHPF